MSKKCPINIKAALKRIEGDLELFEIIIDAFLQEWPRDMESLSHYISSGNYKELERVAHKTKGAVSAIGAENLIELFDNLENLCKDKDIDSADEVFAKIKEEFIKIKDWAGASFNRL